MRYRATFVVGAAVGYLLGTRAGRERYEQIKRLSRRIGESPTVQEVAGLLREQAGAVACTAREKVNAKLYDAFGERVPGVCRPGDREVPRPRATEPTPPRYP
jgi:hypothetical protein